MAVIRRKTSADMTTFLKAARNGRLLGPMERYLQAREPEARPWQMLHPSEISKDGWCPRAMWSVVTSDTRPVKEKVGFQLQRIFDEGHLIHDKYQRYLTGMGVLYGKWRCLECDKVSQDLSTPPAHGCGACGSRNIKYAEVPLTSDEWLISGHADGWVKDLGPDFLIEIKSVGTGTVRIEAPRTFARYDGNLEDIWKNIKRPFSSHLNQGQLYLRVLHQMYGAKAPGEIVFLYECKLNQSAKEFVVTYNEQFTDSIIEKALLVKKHVDLNTPPTCPYGGCEQCKEKVHDRTAA